MKIHIFDHDDRTWCGRNSTEVAMSDWSREADCLTCLKAYKAYWRRWI